MCIRDSNKTDTEYHFTTAEKLAGLAQLVNDKTASVSVSYTHLKKGYISFG